MTLNPCQWESWVWLLVLVVLGLLALAAGKLVYLWIFKD